MRDYKYHIHPAKRLSRRTKPKGAKGGKVSYQFKFYTVIALILGSCYLYIRYQIDHQTQSVFTDLHAIFTKHFKSEEKPKRERRDAPRSKAPGTVKVVETETLYLSKSVGDRVVLVPLREKREAGDKHPFHYLIVQLIAHRPEDRKIVNSFSDDTRLLDVKLEGDVLMLNFNRSFEFNRFGHLGLMVQLQQVLWTVFHSSLAEKERIRSVAFLIEGKRKRKMGGEGLEFKLFYTKNDLKKEIKLGSNV